MNAHLRVRRQVDLTDYEKSGSWDVFNVVANITDETDPDDGHKVSRAKYTIEMRRKTLFYTVNLIIPSVLVSSLSMVVFYLPATAGERITMSVSILLALVVYLQVSGCTREGRMTSSLNCRQEVLSGVDAVFRRDSSQ